MDEAQLYNLHSSSTAGQLELGRQLRGLRLQLADHLRYEHKMPIHVVARCTGVSYKALCARYAIGSKLKKEEEHEQ